MSLESEKKRKWKKFCGQRTTGTRGSLRNPRGPKNVPYITANYQCPAPTKGWSVNIDNVDLQPWLDWTLLLDKLKNCTKETPILYQIKHNRWSFLSWQTSSNVLEVWILPHWQHGLHRFALLQSDISMQCNAFLRFPKRNPLMLGQFRSGRQENKNQEKLKFSSFRLWALGWESGWA